MKDIPTKINKYNVYNDGDRLLGMGDEMSLPDFEASSETITGAGILGEIDDPTVGYFGNQEIEIPFRLLDKEAMSMMDMTKAVHLTIRGACQSTDSEGNIAFKPIRCVVRGRSKKLAAGKFKTVTLWTHRSRLPFCTSSSRLKGSPLSSWTSSTKFSRSTALICWPKLRRCANYG